MLVDICWKFEKHVFPEKEIQSFENERYIMNTEQIESAFFNLSTYYSANLSLNHAQKILSWNETVIV